MYSSVEPDLPYDNGYLIPPPNQSENGQVFDGREDAEASRVVDAASDSLFNKEKQAKLLFEGNLVVTSKCNLTDVQPPEEEKFVT